ncbi:TPA: thiolase domain-containing protein [archaeon]|nr:thiolase domain-containing protein [Candidatus Undinarchaeales archaeon SRR5007147.bin71]
MSQEVAIIGIGMTKFGELWNRSFRQLFVEAGAEALEDAGVKSTEIGALFGGNMSAGQFIGQEHLASLIMDHSNLTPQPATRVEAACASGGLALRTAYMSIKSGMHDVVIAAGAEKMTDVLPSRTTGALATAADQEWEAGFGATFPGLYAMIARRHMHEFGTTEEQLASVSVKNHYNGSKNPKAQFQNEITIESVLSSPMVADPIKLFDCSPVSDGAAALVLASAEKAKELCENPVWIAGSGQASDTLSLHSRKSLTTLNATVEAGRQAYKQAGITSKDIGAAEVHDCFTIAELCAIEDLGFCEKGDSGKFTEQGETGLKGSVPVNTSGGLKTKGHPVGATGIAQAIEASLQLRGEAGDRQIDDVEYVLTHNVGGSGGTAAVHIFSR